MKLNIFIDLNLSCRDNNHLVDGRDDDDDGLRVGDDDGGDDDGGGDVGDDVGDVF